MAAVKVPISDAKKTATPLILSTILFAACAQGPSADQIAARTDVARAELQAASALNETGYADEATDFGVPQQATLRGPSKLHSPTPTTVPGATTIDTARLHDLFVSGEKVVLLDVLGGNVTQSLPGALWLPGAGAGTGFDDDRQRRLAAKMRTLTNGDTATPIVTYCLGADCWLSYNAALRLVRLGYEYVYWYRGGHEAWAAAGLPLVPVRETRW